MGWHDDSFAQLPQLPLRLPLPIPLYLFRQLIAHQWAPSWNCGLRFWGTIHNCRLFIAQISRASFYGRLLKWIFQHSAGQSDRAIIWSKASICACACLPPCLPSGACVLLADCATRCACVQRWFLSFLFYALCPSLPRCVSFVWCGWLTVLPPPSL